VLDLFLFLGGIPDLILLLRYYVRLNYSTSTSRKE
jgi:hypothetical protein